jgi:beta-lactamase class D
MAPAGRKAPSRPGAKAALLVSALAVLLLAAPQDSTRGAEADGLPADAEKRLSAILAGTSSAFVLYDPSHDRFVRYDPERCRRRMSPFSTFKIPNTLIALETGVIKDPDAVVRWDREKHPRQEFWPESWERDHSLRSAFHNSVVWFYQEAAVAVGPERMARFLERFAYGNQDISGGQDRFWLGSSLAISADEQVAFLRAFREDRLGLSPGTTTLARGIFVEETGDGATLSAKTGGGAAAGGRALGWWVGYLEREKAGKVYYFALNTDGESFEAIRDKRVELTKRALRALGLLPKPS